MHGLPNIANHPQGGNPNRVCDPMPRALGSSKYAVISTVKHASAIPPAKMRAGAASMRDGITRITHHSGEAPAMLHSTAPTGNRAPF